METAAGASGEGRRAMTEVTGSEGSDRQVGPAAIRSISAVTLATYEMARAVGFYRSLGFVLRHGGEEAPFTSFSVGSGYLNLIAEPSERRWSWWGRVIFQVADVDALYARAVRLDLGPSAPPRDADWGERYFHLTDPDGHELSFARPLDTQAGPDRPPAG
jgi:hypothetical protein